VGVRSVQGSLESTFDGPYHRFHPSFTTNTKLVWQQEVTSVGVPDDGLGSEPVDHVSNGNGAEATIWLA
jgi:hypothetical protein